ncbi:MAG TPA: HAD hydrolase-like protein, partial [Bacilli bacterium]|nr:HAD hydrolase-like protein [Bacilli bacterium]
MMIKTIFFDLDGTLLPLDQDEFIRVYFYELGKFLDKKNYPKELIIKAVYLAIEAMFKNDGQITNEEVFAKVFTSITKLEYSLLENEFINFYETNFENVKITSKQSPYVKQIIQIVKEKGYKLILATNPLFPKIATYKRINWAGLSPLDFSYITTFE